MLLLTMHFRSRDIQVLKYANKPSDDVINSIEWWSHISSDFSKIFDSLQKDSIGGFGHCERNIFVPRAAYWVSEFHDIKSFSGLF